jgi:hypothetical protein
MKIHKKLVLLNFKKDYGINTKHLSNTITTKRL